MSLKHISNVVIGKIACSEVDLFAFNEEDWETIEKEQTHWTETNFLPKLLVEIGFAPSINEVRRNKPEFVKTLEPYDFIQVKWGKKIVWIAVGEVSDKKEV